MSEILVYILVIIIFIVGISIELIKLLICLSPFIYACYILTEDDPVFKTSNKETREHPYIAGAFILVWIYGSARITYSFCQSWYKYYIFISGQDRNIFDFLYGYGSPETWQYPLGSLTFILITRIIYNKIIGAKSEIS